MQFSHTRFNAYQTCPAQLGFMLDKVPGEEAEILQVGDLAHRFYAEYIKHCLEAEIETDTSAGRAIADRVFNKASEEYAKKDRPFLNLAAYETVWNELLLPFLDSHLAPANVFSIEERGAVTRDLQPTDWFADDVFIRYVIDVLAFEGLKAVITDYKSGWSIDANPSQMELYALVVFALYPHIETVECVFDYTRFNIQKCATFERTDFDAIHTKVESLAVRIEADKQMVPTPGVHCNTCGWRKHCKASARAPESITTSDEAQQAIEAIALMQRDLKPLEEKLKAYCKSNGPVTHNGTIAGYLPTGGLGFDDAKAFHDAALQDGVDDPWKYLSVNGTKVKKLSKRGVYEGRLAAVTVNNRSLRWGFKRAGDDEE